MYAITTDTSTYQYNPSTKKFVIPSDPEYEYSERYILNGTNPG